MEHAPSDQHAPNAANVRATAARLRAGFLAVVLGTSAMLVLAALAVQMAWNDGFRAGEAGPDAAEYIPDPTGFALLIVGYLLIAAVLLVTVRAPYRRALVHAVELEQAQQQLAASTLESFAALNAAVEAKDGYTAGHGLRVTLMSILIGQELDLSDDDLDVLRLAATFHDVGKIAVPDVVLNKPGRLTDAEFETMKVHPVESARICAKLQALTPAVPTIRHHHERYDGKGYPDNISGTSIPLGARIIAVADTWDAITTDRPYRRGQEPFLALEEIRRSAGSQFDPRVVAAFVEVLAKDPWMFGLTPQDVSDKARSVVPAPSPASRGVDRNGDGINDLHQAPIQIHRSVEEDDQRDAA